MLSKRTRQFAFAVALLAIASMMIPMVASADAIAGSGPANALAPASTAQHLNVGQQTWYVFSTAGKDADNTPSKVLVRMRAQPEGSANFNIWSQARMQARNVADNPDRDAPAVGKGFQSKMNDGGNDFLLYGGDLIWTDSFKQPATYYVQVVQNGAQPSDYVLSITGDAVSFPTMQAQNQLASNTTKSGPNAAPLVLPATGNDQSLLGRGPESALMATGQTTTVKPGQQVWYKVQFPGTRDSDVHPNVFAELMSFPNNAAKFTVWTPERLRARAIADNPNKDAPAVGYGLVMDYKDGDNTLSRYSGNPVWLGDAKEAGTYYIVVEPAGQSAAQYQLHVALQQ